MDNSFTVIWSPLISVDAISELTKHDWKFIFNKMYIIEFYLYLTYLTNKRNFENDLHKKQLNKRS